MSLTVASRRRRFRLRFGRCILAAFGAVTLAWLAGFAWFLCRVGQPPVPPPRADGIVVLTGGAERVRAGLLLLTEHRANSLLVTGIGGRAGLRDLAHVAELDAAPLAERITLGRGATSTRGNAEEIAAWVRANGLRSLIVVTASYHMPRALAEIRRALPGLDLYPASVSPPRAGGALAGARQLVEEYTKLLGAELGLAALTPGPGPSLSGASAGSY